MHKTRQKTKKQYDKILTADSQVFVYMCFQDL